MGSDNLGHCRSESDHVVANFSLDLVDAFQTKVSALADGPGRIFGDDARSANVSVAATSTASQVRKRFSSLQMRPISGRV